MLDATPLFDDTLRILRDTTQRHGQALQGLTRPSRPGPGFEALEATAERVRAIEDEAIAAVCGLSRHSDRTTALRAIHEARAGWLLDVILNRAAETATPRGSARRRRGARAATTRHGGGPLSL